MVSEPQLSDECLYLRAIRAVADQVQLDLRNALPEVTDHPHQDVRTLLPREPARSGASAGRGPPEVTATGVRRGGKRSRARTDPGRFRQQRRGRVGRPPRRAADTRSEVVAEGACFEGYSWRPANLGRKR